MFHAADQAEQSRQRQRQPPRLGDENQQHIERRERGEEDGRLGRETRSMGLAGATL